MAESEKVCPVCGGEVNGSAEHKYFCKKCRLIFTEKEVAEKKEEKD